MNCKGTNSTKVSNYQKKAPNCEGYVQIKKKECFCTVLIHKLFFPEQIDDLNCYHLSLA